MKGGDDFDAEEVNEALTRCQATAQERNALIERERLRSLSDYAELTNRDITDLAAKLERRTIADGRVILPAKVLKNIQALCFWAREKTRKGEQLRAEDFTARELASTKEAMRTREEGQNEAPSIKPEKFDPDKWTSWSKQFVTYLSHVQGQQFSPLDYVLRQEPPPIPVEEMSERDRVLYSFPLTGRHFNLDNMTAYRLLSDLVHGTSGYTWISSFDRPQNGRAAWLALVEHYEGGGQKEKRMSAAMSTIKALHYKNESVFSFEDFSRKLVQAYRDLEGTDEEFNEFNKVKTLLEKIQITLPRAEVAKSHVRQNYRQDVYGAIEYLGTEFADMFADAISFKRGRTRGIGAVERPPQRQRTNDTEPHHTPDGITTFFGVDVTDVSRTFTSHEMSMLGPRGQAYIFQERERLGASKSNNPRGGRGFRGGRGGFRGGGRGNDHRRRIGAIDAVTMDDVSDVTHDQTRLPPPAAAESRPPSVPPPPGMSQGEHNRGSQNGSSFGAGAYRS
jgi:hypothetical protein